MGAPDNVRAFERLILRGSLPKRDESWHLLLSDFDFSAADLNWH